MWEGSITCLTFFLVKLARDDWTLFGGVFDLVQACEARAARYRSYPLFSIHPIEVEEGVGRACMAVMYLSLVGFMSAFKHLPVQFWYKDRFWVPQHASCVDCCYLFLFWDSGISNSIFCRAVTESSQIGMSGLSSVVKKMCTHAIYSLAPCQNPNVIQLNIWDILIKQLHEFVIFRICISRAECRPLLVDSLVGTLLDEWEQGFKLLS